MQCETVTALAQKGLKYILWQIEILTFLAKGIVSKEIWCN